MIYCLKVDSTNTQYYMRLVGGVKALTVSYTDAVVIDSKLLKTIPKKDVRFRKIEFNTYIRQYLFYEAPHFNKMVYVVLTKYDSSESYKNLDKHLIDFKGGGYALVKLKYNITTNTIDDISANGIE